MKDKTFYGINARFATESRALPPKHYPMSRLA
jgi:hypothetical protein